MNKLCVNLTNTTPMRLNVAFDCAPGEMVALVGPSGSGKSSALRAIAGLLQSGSLRGRVSVGDAVWFDTAHAPHTPINLTPQARRVGFVFQNYALFPHLTAIENIAIAAYKLSAKDALALFVRLGMAGLEQRLPSEMSGGQQQRVALARALARQPAVLLLDEPFSAVDAPSRTSLYRELANLRQSALTPMVLVTHDLQEARRLADRVVILDAGDTLQIGPPEQIFSRPRNARVAELVGIQNHFQGLFFKSGEAPDANALTNPSNDGRLVWLAHGKADTDQTTPDDALHLTVVDKNKLMDGARVSWVLDAEHVDIRLIEAKEDGFKTNQPSNTLRCAFEEILSLGETSICTVVLVDYPALFGVRLTLTLSSSHLRSLGLSNAVEAQTAVWVHLPPHSIHIMPIRTADV